MTPNGSGNEESAFDAYTFFSIAFWIAVTALGLVVNLVPEWSRIGEGEFSVVSAWWAVINIAVSMVAALICFEKSEAAPRQLRHRRGGPDRARGREARRPDHQPALEGGIVELDAAPAVKPGDTVIVEMERFPPLRCTIESVSRLRHGFAMTIRFRLEGECRDRMIVKLYTGQYSQDIRTLDKSAIARGLWSRLFGRTTQAAT